LILLTGLLLSALLAALLLLTWLLLSALLAALLLAALLLLARFLIRILIHHSVLSNIDNDPKRHLDRSRPDIRQCAAEIFVPIQPTVNFEENVFGTSPPRDEFPK
jgi:membrane protein implicated in regulation of membrane protease activity